MNKDEETEDMIFSFLFVAVTIFTVLFVVIAIASVIWSFL
jgi:nitrate reductase NapE component